MERAIEPGAGAPRLSERDTRILVFEREWWRHGGAKEGAIRSLFGLGVTEYFQVLNVLLDSEAALAYDPMLVKRLRRMRDARQRGREARQLGLAPAR
ncbi:MAG: DUF3263 domain-containing protein [Demequinaceae bacterium]|nr:DUF3263 domain-containing protein [Demequinaceae bacterium]